ncbi:glycosyltransferase [Rhodococcus sp. MSC1_016]|uniref:glycosyltransferase n=1 Tax=Rhodococcus sp. MSC1_016 TaxID=2909266 RepID=UPI00202F1AB7|nr:glycosyltransferase [Rhodococcus sp. MSC1_016]
MIGYYIHHHGHGHRMRASSISAQLQSPVTTLSSAPPPPAGRFADSIALARDDRGSDPVNPTADGALHWAPTHDTGLRTRMARIVSWIDATRPDLVVVDVSVEVAALVRLLGVPVVLIAMPGERTDAPHHLGYQLADHIIAAWPQNLYDPRWLREFAHKTTFVGGISRFEGRAVTAPDRSVQTRILVLSGAGGTSLTMDDIRHCAHEHRNYRWQALGIPGAPWAEDPWPHLCGCDVVVSHAGQNAVADIAVARRPSIIIGQPRPFDEQVETARALGNAGLAVSIPRWPETSKWPQLVDRALALGGDRWVRWQTSGAAARAAAVIDSVAKRAGGLR